MTASIHITRKAPEIVQINLNSYTLGTSYCKQKLVRGGVSNFVKKNREFNHQIDIKHHSNGCHKMLCNKNLSSLTYVHFLLIYRATTGEFKLFLNKETSHLYFYKSKLHLSSVVI
jgi:hypothetical protein